ncbi:MAG: hypothetical protein R3324_08600, partial [Halobacteriales archaeon]|nr:hypothetical protein [Halobacteriales archaeon]
MGRRDRASIDDLLGDRSIAFTTRWYANTTLPGLRVADVSEGSGSANRLVAALSAGRLLGAELRDVTPKVKIRHRYLRNRAIWQKQPVTGMTDLPRQREVAVGSLRGRVQIPVERMTDAGTRVVSGLRIFLEGRLLRTFEGHIPPGVTLEIDGDFSPTVDHQTIVVDERVRELVWALVEEIPALMSDVGRANESGCAETVHEWHLSLASGQYGAVEARDADGPGETPDTSLASAGILIGVESILDDALRGTTPTACSEVRTSDVGGGVVMDETIDLHVYRVWNRGLFSLRELLEHDGPVHVLEQTEGWRTALGYAEPETFDLLLIASTTQARTLSLLRDVVDARPTLDRACALARFEERPEHQANLEPGSSLAHVHVRREGLNIYAFLRHPGRARASQLSTYLGEEFHRIDIKLLYRERFLSSTTAKSSAGQFRVVVCGVEPTDDFSGPRDRDGVVSTVQEVTDRLLLSWWQGCCERRNYGGDARRQLFVSTSILVAAGRLGADADEPIEPLFPILDSTGGRTDEFFVTLEELKLQGERDGGVIWYFRGRAPADFRALSADRVLLLGERT